MFLQSNCEIHTDGVLIYKADRSVMQSYTEKKRRTEKCPEAEEHKALDRFGDGRYKRDKKVLEYLVKQTEERLPNSTINEKISKNRLPR